MRKFVINLSVENKRIYITENGIYIYTYKH